MASSPDVHVAVGHCGKLLASSDGKSWRRVGPDVRTFFRGVTFARGVFVAVGGSYVDLPGVILTPTDGQQWTIRRCGSKTVFHTGFEFVATNRAARMTSSDGLIWTKSGGETNLALQHPSTRQP